MVFTAAKLLAKKEYRQVNRDYDKGDRHLWKLDYEGAVP